jgi:hypothetical protein
MVLSAWLSFRLSGWSRLWTPRLRPCSSAKGSDPSSPLFVPIGRTAPTPFPPVTLAQPASEATRPPVAVEPARIAQHPVLRTRVECRPGSRQPARLVISGRMADVCAEIDRLVALESAPAARCLH